MRLKQAALRAGRFLPLSAQCFSKASAKLETVMQRTLRLLDRNPFI